MDVMLVGTMGTAIEDPFGFHAVTNDAAPAVGAGGRKRMDGAFETVEYMRFTTHSHLKPFIVFVSAHITFAKLSLTNKEI